MLNIPILRWGKPYESLEVDDVVHFMTGEPIAKVSQANAGLLQRDMRKAPQAREALRDIPCDELIERVKKAGELYLNATLPLGDGTQSPDEFAHMQSASTGLPEHMCKANMQKNFFVLSHMDQMLDALTRGLDLNILSNGYGVESRGVVVSYPGASAGRGPGAAVEFARRAHAVAAGDSDADRPGAQAGPARALDAVSHGGRVHRRPAFRPRRSRSIPAAATSAPRCWPTASAA